MATIKEVTSFADIKVQVVTAFPDLCVYVTPSQSEARGSDSIWYFSDSFPDRKIQIVTSFPDLKVQYVTSKFNAGWKNTSHPLQHKIG